MRDFAIHPTTLALLSCIIATTAIQAEDWPQFRGPNRDGISAESNLIPSWKQSPPPLRATIRGLGRGYASLAITGQTLYTTGEQDGKQFVIAIDLPPDSEPVIAWKTHIGNAGDISYPGSRCTPTIDADRIYATTTAGDVVCLERTAGTIAWTRNMPRDFDGHMMSGWGFSESPLIDGQKVVITPGALDAALVALDKLTGKEIWRSKIPATGGAAYASIIPTTAAGVPQYVTLLGRGAVAVNAMNGQLLWNYDRIANTTANIPSPIVDGDYVFTSTGYGAGAALLRIQKKPGGLAAEEVYFLDGKTFQNHHGGMVKIGDYLYAGTGHNNGFPICLEFLTGKIAWRQPRGPGQRSAAVIAADNNLYFRYESGTMALIEASPEKYQLKGTFDIPDVRDPSWPHPAIADGLLYLREQDRLHVYDCRANQ